MLSHVTFTGWDRHTDLTELQTWLEDCRQQTVEIAVLYSARQDDDDRYPEWGQAIEILRTAKAADQRTAVHICGRTARDLLDSTGPASVGGMLTLPWEASSLIPLAERVQVNVPEDFWAAGPEKYKRAHDLARLIGRPVIVQSRDLEAWPEVGHLHPHADRMVPFLFDRSAGRGEVISKCPVPPPDRLVGYAGGLSPDNVDNFMRSIYGGRVWLDMETGIREQFSTARRGPNDPEPGTYVSLTKCQRVMSAVGRWLEGR